VTHPIVETAKIRLRSGVSEQQLLAASRRFQAEFLDQQPGFMKRELLRLDAGNYLDLVHWRSAEEAQAIMAHVPNSAACASYFSVMEMGNGDLTEGVAHYTSLAVYEAGRDG
jgi:hypothetical protein